MAEHQNNCNFMEENGQPIKMRKITKKAENELSSKGKYFGQKPLFLPHPDF